MVVYRTGQSICPRRKRELCFSFGYSSSPKASELSKTKTIRLGLVSKFRSNHQNEFGKLRKSLSLSSYRSFPRSLTMSSEESYTGLPTSHLLGSVPAVISEEKDTTTHHIPEANLQIFPPNNGGIGRGYQTIGGPSEGDGQQSTNSWKGVFSISSYTQYFNVDTDIVLNRMTSSLFPSGDFFSKIDANPDLYGLVWISTTLVFVIASLGNCATYLMHKRSDSKSLWSFDVSYVNMAAGSVYGYSLVVPLVFYFLLQYLGSNVSLIRFWCMWGYSLFIFILSSFLLVIPVEFLRWTIIVIAGAASASFVTLNLRSYIQTNDLTVVLVAACVLQYGLAFFIKMWFFP